MTKPLDARYLVLTFVANPILTSGPPARAAGNQDVPRILVTGEGSVNDWGQGQVPE
jgi:hypothetical protein